MKDTDRKSLIRLASTLPVGDASRQALLSMASHGKVASVSEKEVAAINKMTDQNDHTGAARALAKALGRKRDEKILTHMEALRDLYGHMPHQLDEMKREITKGMYDEARRITMPDGRSLYDHLD